MRFATYCAAILFAASASVARAAAYYAGPASSLNTLSQDANAPGDLATALDQAPDGSTIILEDGTYEAGRRGFALAGANVTVRAQHWHGATIRNQDFGELFEPARNRPEGDTVRGIIFGPSTGMGGSGGGGTNWSFQDCMFTHTGGWGLGNNSGFVRCVFSDAAQNSFDLAGRDQYLRDCILRRSNRSAADDDSVGSKEDLTKNFMVDGLVAYDNDGPSLWYDTDCEGWEVMNSTFFADHGGGNWLYCTVNSPVSTSQFIGTGQDTENLKVGQHIKALTGTKANIGKHCVITAVSGNNPQTITFSPAMPEAPQSRDRFIVIHGDSAPGDGFNTEANDNGIFVDNVVYANVGRGFYDHASGGTTYGGPGGIVVQHNLLAYNGEDFDYMPDGRDDGPAQVTDNQFKFKPGSSLAIGSGGWCLGQYPGALHVVFDDNIYDAESGTGQWAKWSPGTPAVTAGGLTVGSQPEGQDYLQDPATWNQDQHSMAGTVEFRGTPPKTYDWPPAGDTNWSDVFFPNNTFGLKNSIHQIDDTDGAVVNTIDSALAGRHTGDIVMLPVSAHMPIAGDAVEVYDLNGRWMKLTISPADQAAFLATVPAYVTCVPGNRTKTYTIRVVIGSTDSYTPTALYTLDHGAAPAAPKLLSIVGGDHQASLVWTASAGATSYSIGRRTSTQPEGTVVIAEGITQTSFTDGADPAEQKLDNGMEYEYTVQAVNSYGRSANSEMRGAMLQTVQGSLVATSVSASDSTTTNLTALGTIDWRQWGDMAGSNHKATGGGQISDLTRIGAGTFGRWSGPFRNVAWTDSASGYANSDDQNFTWANTVQNSGWSFTVPADTTSRTLSILWGGSDKATIKLSAHLSDSSAPDYNESRMVSDPGRNQTYLESITYNAVAPGQSLTLTLTKADAIGGDTSPSVDLMAACLQ